MLEDLARTDKNIKAVVVLIGANDYGFADILETCVTNWITSPSWWKNYCHDDANMKAMFSASNITAITNNVHAFNNLKTAMTNAGYDDTTTRSCGSHAPLPDQNPEAIGSFELGELHVRPRWKHGMAFEHGPEPLKRLLVWKLAEKHALRVAHVQRDELQPGLRVVDREQPDVLRLAHHRAKRIARRRRLDERHRPVARIRFDDRVAPCPIVGDECSRKTSETVAGELGTAPVGVVHDHRRAVFIRHERDQAVGADTRVPMAQQSGRFRPVARGPSRPHGPAGNHCRIACAFTSLSMVSSFTCDRTPAGASRIVERASAGSR